MARAVVLEIFTLEDIPHKKLKKDVHFQWQIIHLFASLNQISCDWLPWLGRTGEDDEYSGEQLGGAM